MLTARRVPKWPQAPDSSATCSQHSRRPGADPVLINTSFNTRGEPIVNTADEALRSAATIGVDFLVIGDDLFVPA